MGPKRKWKAYTREKQEQNVDQDFANIDSILDKISAKGYENLTATEKRILDNYSRKKNEESEEK
jgi:hypothetical protein